MAKKTGVRRSEQNQIRQMMEDGSTIDEVSDALLIERDVVESFFEHFGAEVEEDED